MQVYFTANVTRKLKDASCCPLNTGFTIVHLDRKTPKNKLMINHEGTIWLRMNKTEKNYDRRTNLG